MSTLRQIAQEISTYLVDQEPGFEFSHWTEEELVTYARDAGRVLASYAKSHFVSTHVIQLVPGTTQSLPCDCEELVEVIGQVDKYGSVLQRARQSSRQTVGLLKRQPCPTRQGREYRVSDYAVSLQDLGAFEVFPPVPAHTPVRVKVRCLAAPSFDSMDSVVSIPAHLIPALKELMLYYAYGVDTESVPARDYMAKHWAAAMQLLGVDVGAAARRSTATLGT